jgi:hypothetical protein
MGVKKQMIKETCCEPKADFESGEKDKLHFSLGLDGPENYVFGALVSDLEVDADVDFLNMRFNDDYLLQYGFFIVGQA